MKLFLRRKQLTYGRLILVFLFFMTVNFMSMYFYHRVLTMKVQSLAVKLQLAGMPSGQIYAISQAMADIKYHTSAYVYHTTLMIALFTFFIGASSETARHPGRKDHPGNDDL